MVCQRLPDRQPRNQQNAVAAEGAELQWLYQYYSLCRAGYEKYRDDFAKLIWQIASPKWKFDNATFERTAASFNNPDHVSIVIHNYRWRLGVAEGEPKYDDLEKRLAEFPVINVPTITIQGDARSASRPEFEGEEVRARLTA